MNNKRGGKRKYYPKKDKTLARTKKDQIQDKEISNLKKKVKKLDGDIETKQIDTFVNAVEAVNDPGTTQMILLNGCAQGVTNGQHIGDDIVLTSIQVRGDIQSDNDNIAAPTEARIIVFMDHQSNGAAPTAAQLLDNVTITRLLNAPYNMDYIERFKILYDRRFCLNPVLAASTTIVATVTSLTTIVPITTVFQFKKRLGQRVNYGLNSGGTITAISKNSIYVLLLSNSTDASNVGPFVTLGVRVNYKDA